MAMFLDTGTGGSSTVWSYWCTATTTSTATTGIWYEWCNESTTNAVTQIYTNTSNTWGVWCNEEVIREHQRPVQSVEHMKAAHRIAELEKARQRAEYNEALKAQKAAEERAEKLLVENLDLQQRLEFEKTKTFFVYGRSGGRYRIRRGRSGNIDVIAKNGRVDHRLCIHPDEWVPDFDTMLAQKLLLEHDEKEVMRIANRHPIYEVAHQLLPSLLH